MPLGVDIVLLVSRQDSHRRQRLAQRVDAFGGAARGTVFQLNLAEIRISKDEIVAVLILRILGDDFFIEVDGALRIRRCAGWISMPAAKLRPSIEALSHPREYLDGVRKQRQPSL